MWLRVPLQILVLVLVPPISLTPVDSINVTVFKFKRYMRIKSVANCWIFVVTDQDSINLSAEQIYLTRMNDKFWGLNQRTPFRKSLKKGDKVIFSRGSKT